MSDICGTDPTRLAIFRAKRVGDAYPGLNPWVERSPYLQGKTSFTSLLWNSVLANASALITKKHAMWARCIIFLRVFFLCGLTEADDHGKPSDFLKQVKLAMEQNALTFAAEYTGEVFGNLSGGSKSGATYEGLLRLSLQLDLARVACWQGATVYGSMLYPHGEGLTDHYTGDFNGLSNIDAYDTVRLFELWFQQKFFGDLFSIRVGQISADLEFYQSTTSNLFINSCFGTFPTIGLGTNLPIYPVGGLGARIDYRPNGSLAFRAALFDSNPGIQNLNDKHGTRFHLSPNAGLIFVAEGVYQTRPTTANRGIVGTYTLGGYYDSRQYTGDFIHPAHSANGGLYAIADQVVYRAEPYVDEKSSQRGLSIFTSCAVAPSDRNLVSLYLDVGCNYLGLLPGRGNDIFGIAASFTKIGDDVVKNGRVIHSGHETVIETSYKLQLNEHIYLQPDLQYILHPGAFGNHPNAFVSGLRFDFTF
jgi:porin